MKHLQDDPKILAFVLDELEGREKEEFAAQVEADPELQKLVAGYRELGDALRSSFATGPEASLTDDQRATIESALQTDRSKPKLFSWCLRVAAVAVLGLAAWIGAQVFQYSRQDQQRPPVESSRSNGQEESVELTGDADNTSKEFPSAGVPTDETPEPAGKAIAKQPRRSAPVAPKPGLRAEEDADADPVDSIKKSRQTPATAPKDTAPPAGKKDLVIAERGLRSKAARARAPEKGRSAGTLTLESDEPAPRRLKQKKGSRHLKAFGGGKLQESKRAAGGVRIDAKREMPQEEAAIRRDESRDTDDAEVLGSHDRIVENQFISAWTAPFSTFSIDVDTASYTMVRKELNNGRLPAPDAVRIEEMVNYFDYTYAPPTGEHPFAVHLETASCPWNQKHRLVRIGLQGKEISNDQRPAANLVFLLDVSGSMNNADKLPLVKAAMERLTAQLKPADRVAIVVYAGAAGVVLPSTAGDNQQRILESLHALRAGGSTAGGAGIKLAYSIAQKNYIQDGVNRVILCTDGDFNVGVTGRGALERMIEAKAKTGVFLTILGFGRGNYKDDRMEALSNKGNGNYAYIDSQAEAEKVLVKQVGGTLVTIAKDVKIQVNFNKHKVHSYRLIGYENRMLKKQDFNDDKKDAGEIGAGISVTAMYEVVPLGVGDVEVVEADEDKYAAADSAANAVPSDELLTVRLRYKQPDADQSVLLEEPLIDRGKRYSNASTDFKFASAVAAFAMILRDSEHRAGANYETVLELAAEGAEPDPHGYRKEFLELVRKARALAK